MFIIKIQPNKINSYSKHKKTIEYDEELDDITSVILDICSYFEELNVISFLVQCFTDMKWPVDVESDLASIIPQVPNALEKLKIRANFSIQFFEQGIERELHFKCEKNDVLIECFSLLGNPVTSEIEKIQYEDLFSMLKSLIEKFISISKTVCPIVTNHFLFKEWESAYYDI